MSKRPLSETFIRIGEIASALNSLTIALAGCAQAPSFSSTQIPETPTPKPTETTPTPIQTPTPETGATIPGIEPGKTLKLEGRSLNIQTFDPKEIANLLGKYFTNDWKIIVDQETQSIFNLTFTDQEGRHYLILPHAPENYQWDEKNKIWTNTQNPHEILFSQVALPGGWNEQTQMAGPTAAPDMAVMLRDPEGNIQVGLVYKEEDLMTAEINPQSLQDQYHPLSDGRYLFLSKVDLTLQPRQTIEAVFDPETKKLLYHRIINPDGSWFMVLTSWDQVKNRQETPHMFEPIGIQVGDEITSIPYPSDKIVNSLGINKYGNLPDGSYVAYQTVTDEQTGETKRLVVAQAIFETKNGKKVFKEWQKTIPLENLAVTDPRATNPELFDLKKPDAPIPQFANALKNVGINLTPEQIAGGITYVSTKEDGTPLVDKDGNPFIVAVYNLDPSLFPEKYRNLAGPIPLMIAEKGENGEWMWKRPKLYKIFRLAGIKYVGALMDEGRDVIIPLVKGNFNTQIVPFYNVDLGAPEDVEKDKFAKEEKEIGFRLTTITENYLVHGPISFPTSDFHNLPEEEKVNIIKERLERIKRYGIPNIVGIQLYGELHESSYTNDEIILVAKIAKEMFPDIKIAYSDTDNHYPEGMWTNYTKETLGILGDNIDAVVVQMHLAQWPYQVNQLPTAEDIAKTLSSYGKEVWIGEFDITTAHLRGSMEEKRMQQAEIAYNHVGGALRSEVVTVFNIWGLTDNATWYDYSWQQQDFKDSEPLPFDKNNQPKLYYFYILKAILDYLR